MTATGPPDGADDDDARLLAALGARVRGLRRAQGRTVLEVATQADLSERFIAMIEAGRGNPSLLSLSALSRALRVDVTALLGSAPSSGAAPRAMGAAHVVALLGLRGAGKTTIGAAAAARLGVSFIELDAEVERDAGLATAAIFELHGAESYRRLEREALARVLRQGTDAIVATTGGLVTDHAALETTLAASTTIWLRARPEDHFRRVVEQGDTRPMQNRDRAMDELRAILRERRPSYERAEHVVDTSRLGLPRSVARVAKIARGVLAG